MHIEREREKTGKGGANGRLAAARSFKDTNRGYLAASGIVWRWRRRKAAAMRVAAAKGGRPRPR